MNLKVAPDPLAAKKPESKIENLSSEEIPDTNTRQDLILGIAATIIALASLGVQLWTMLS